MRFRFTILVEKASLFLALAAVEIAVSGKLEAVENPSVLVASGDPIDGHSGVAIRMRTVRYAMGAGGHALVGVDLAGEGVGPSNNGAVVTTQAGRPIRLVLREGQTVTGAITGTFTGSVSKLHIDESGEQFVLEDASVRDSDGVLRIVSIAGTVGSMSIFFSPNMPATELGAGAVITDIGPVWLTRTGTIMYHVFVSGAGPRFNGIMLGPVGSETLRIRSGITLPGMANETWFNSVAPLDVSDSGLDILFQGSYPWSQIWPPAPGASDSKFVSVIPPIAGGLWRLSEGRITELARLGSQVPGGPEGAQFSSFATATMSPSGSHIAFVDANGVFAGTPSSIEFVASRSTVAHGAGGLTFSEISGPQISDNGLVLFRGAAGPGGGTVRGFWVWDGGSIRLLAANGSPTPGFPDNTFGEVSSAAMNDVGSIAISGEFAISPIPIPPGKPLPRSVWLSKEGSPLEYLTGIGGRLLGVTDMPMPNTEISNAQFRDQSLFRLSGTSVFRGSQLALEVGIDGNRSTHLAQIDVDPEPYPALTFSRWKEQLFTANELSNSAITGNDVDLDGDRLGTALEYVTGDDPWFANPSQLPRVELADIDGEPRAVLVVRISTQLSEDVSVQIQHSSDLRNWRTFYEFDGAPGEGAQPVHSVVDAGPFFEIEIALPVASSNATTEYCRFAVFFGGE